MHDLIFATGPKEHSGLVNRALNCKIDTVNVLKLRTLKNNYFFRCS